MGTIIYGTTNTNRKVISLPYFSSYTKVIFLLIHISPFSCFSFLCLFYGQLQLCVVEYRSIQCNAMRYSAKVCSALQCLPQGRIKVAAKVFASTNAGQGRSKEAYTHLKQVFFSGYLSICSNNAINNIDIT